MISCNASDRGLLAMRQTFVCAHGKRVKRCERIDKWQYSVIFGRNDSESTVFARAFEKTAKYADVRPAVDVILVKSPGTWTDSVHTEVLAQGTPYEYRAVRFTFCYEHVLEDLTAEKVYRIRRPRALPPQLCLHPDGTSSATYPEEDDALFALSVALAPLDPPVLLVLEIFDAWCDYSHAKYPLLRRWAVASHVKARVRAALEN